MHNKCNMISTIWKAWYEKDDIILYEKYNLQNLNDFLLNNNFTT